MVPIRYLHEVEYYDNVLAKYKEMLQQHADDQNTHMVVLHELVNLMDELNQENPNRRQLINRITQKIIILLLSLFEMKDTCTDYENYCNLNDMQKQEIKRQLAPLLFNL